MVMEWPAVHTTKEAVQPVAYKPSAREEQSTEEVEERGDEEVEADEEGDEVTANRELTGKRN